MYKLLNEATRQDLDRAQLASTPFRTKEGKYVYVVSTWTHTDRVTKDRVTEYKLTDGTKITRPYP